MFLARMVKLTVLLLSRLREVEDWHVFLLCWSFRYLRICKLPKKLGVEWLIEKGFLLAAGTGDEVVRRAVLGLSVCGRARQAEAMTAAQGEDIDRNLPA